MAKSIDKFNKRRLVTSYFSVTLSIALVLFLLGLLGFLLLNAQRLANYFKEQVSVSVSLKDDAKEADVVHLKKILSVAEFTKSVRFVSKEEAAEQFSQEIGEDFLSFIGVNPLQNSIDLSLKAAYAEPGKMEEIAKEIGQNPFVSEVTYDKPLVALIHENVEKISLIILIISGLFTIIAILLINSSIRLSIYSKRFTIKTMQLVGATPGFIRRPFIITNVRLGVYGAIFAMLLLYGCISYLNSNFPEFGLITDHSITVVVFSSILIIGVFITWLSTFFAAQRFLNLNTNDLYY